MSNHGGPANRATEQRLASAAANAAPRITGATHIGADARTALAGYFGRALSDREIRDLVGAPANAAVSVHVGEHSLLGSATRAGGHPAVDWEVQGPALPNATHGHEEIGRLSFTAHRVLHADMLHPEQTIMENVRFIMHDDTRGQGLGTAMFAREVAALTRLNAELPPAQRITAIGTSASRSGDYLHGYRHNGFYTWPMLGYDKPMTRQDLYWLLRTPAAGSRLARRVAGDPQAHTAAEDAYKGYARDHTPEALALTPVRTATKARLLLLAARGRLHLSDILATPDGQAWWKYHGTSEGVHFDLAPGSRSQTTLAAYLARRATEGRPAPAIA